MVEAVGGDVYPVPAVIADGLPSATVAIVQAQAESRSRELFNHLLLRFDEVDRVCQLTPPQRTKLKVAVKGAVDHAIAKWIASTVEPGKLPEAGIDGNHIVFVPADLNVVGGNFEFQVNEVFIGIAPVFQQPVAMNDLALAEGWVDAAAKPKPVATLTSADFAAIERESIWQEALRRVLSEPQRRAVQQAAEARAEMPRDTLGNHVLAEIARQLLLDGNQRQAVAGFLPGLIKGQFLTPGNIAEARISALANTMMRSLPADRLADVLSEAQFDYWKSRFRATPPSASGSGAANASFDDLLDLINRTVEVNE
jgi:hypothetical protein